jgi:hypothetical protein
MKKPDMDNWKYRIFISYSSKDRSIVRLMARILEREFGKGKIRPFFDDKFIEGGDSIPKEILNEITKCHEFLVLFTTDALKSKWVDAEVGAAWGRKKRIIGFKFKIDKKNERNLPPMSKDIKHFNLDDFESGYLPELAMRIMEKRKKGGRKI